MSISLPQVVAKRFDSYKKNLSFGPEQHSEGVPMRTAVDHFVRVEREVDAITSHDQKPGDHNGWTGQVKLSTELIASIKPGFESIETDFEGKAGDPNSALSKMSAGDTVTYQWTGFLESSNRSVDMKAIVGSAGIEFKAISMNFYGYFAESAQIKESKV